MEPTPITMQPVEALRFTLLVMRISERVRGLQDVQKLIEADQVEARAIAAQYGLDGRDFRLVVDAGGPHPVGTVVDPTGRPMVLVAPEPAP